MEEALKSVKKSTLKASYDSVVIKSPQDEKNIVAKWALLYNLKK